MLLDERVVPLNVENDPGKHHPTVPAVSAMPAKSKKASHRNRRTYPKRGYSTEPRECTSRRVSNLNVKHNYVVGPRPIYPDNPTVRADGCVIVVAESQSEGEPAKESAILLSPALAAHVRDGKPLSCAVISEPQISKWIHRGAKDMR
jgi:hypothetical protein